MGGIASPLMTGIISQKIDPGEHKIKTRITRPKVARIEKSFAETISVM
jgi:hypothetical protein